MTDTISYQISKDIPVTHDVDVAVIGGGPGGIGASVLAARTGADVLLVERYGFLGGMAAAGEVHPFMTNHLDGKSLDKPVYAEWVRAMAKYASAHRKYSNTDAEGLDRRISKDVAMLAAEDIVTEAGAKLLYHHTLADAIVRDGKIEAAVFLSKSGFSAVRAKVFVDCTGDGDLAAISGCEFEQGGPSGHCQPMTLCFKLSHVDRRGALKDERQEITQLYLKARENGEIDCPRNNVLLFHWFDDDVIHFNTTRIIQKSGTNGQELSAAEIEGRRQARQFFQFLRKHVKGFENAVFHSIAHHIGVRETRRIRGINYITREAFVNQTKFPDAIARVRYPIDIHSPTGGDTELIAMPADNWYEIPYGCVVARDVSNLLVGGRPISVDHAIHSSMRVMAPACSVGQAAGLAAAMSAAQNCPPANLDGKQVRNRLIEYGAALA